MEFRLLGEPELRAGGQLFDLGTPRQQAVLAVLAVESPRPVAIETLVDRVWDDAPPVAARNVLYSHLSRIRRLLADAAARSPGLVARIERRHAGYALTVEPDRVDLHRFTRLVERGHDPLLPDDDRAGALAEALALWRGTPLAGVPGSWAEQVRGTWHQRRVDAVVRWGRIELRLGHPDRVITAGSALAAEYPLVEPIEVLLMRALHLAGRDAEAVDRYTATRQRLADELGTDPGPELRALHRAILRGEPPAPAVPERVVPAARTVTPPAQLPPDGYGFAGRDRELSQLDGLLAVAGAQPTALAIVTVSGTAGVGKTTLAVHWAHLVRDRFPDGQLHLNLRGFDPSGTPVAPAEAVRGFLDALGVPTERTPAGFEAQVGLYRSLLAGRRVLLLLDNARDAEQVRPLLPGAPGCLVVVTSRDELTGLIAEGARPLTLDLFDDDDARELLARRLGPERVAAEPEAVTRIVALCARLPLALAVLAARAATHPGFGLGVLADELGRARGGLDEFAGGDPATDARAVFSWSYLQLSPGAARMFRLLGLHPGPDIGTSAAASLAGLPVAPARALLAELARAHLVTQHTPGRYVCHDLLRAYANEQAHLVDPPDERRAALRRMLAHYVHSADVADRLLNPLRFDPPVLAAPPTGVTVDGPPDHGSALVWFDAERRVLLATLRQVTGFDVEVWQLAWMLRRFLSYQGHWQDSIDALSAALAAARRLDDSGRQAFAHCFLACAHVWFGRYETARVQFDTALELYRVAGDRIGEGNTHFHYSWMLDRQDRHPEALAHAERSFEAFRAVGHRAGQARALNAIGWFHTMQGRHAEALVYCRQALEIQGELDDRLAQAETWDSLGYAHMLLGQHDEAISCYRTAIELYQDFHYSYNRAHGHAALGDAHHAAGDLESAGAAWRVALDLLDGLGHPEAEAVRTKVEKLRAAGPSADEARANHPLD
ncbi:BTAD domain-containing putative transcriptional regulator [Micromonospora sp. NPDC049523]|uniref:AfsR/SARP family transcriptional regulator n=1 Tax=Micromonospora sp. NPDC049523 TaxID=3155921 RepID=UPI0034362BC4